MHNIARLHTLTQYNFDHVKYLIDELMYDIVHIHYLFVPVSYTSLITVLHTMPHYKIDGFCPISFYSPVVPCVYQPTCQSLQEEFDQRNAHYESRKKEVIGTYTLPLLPMHP